MNKSKFFNCLPILAVVLIVVCIFIFTSCKDDDTANGKLTEKSYYSNTTNAKRKCIVYTPPGYDPNDTYPVMYLLHGIGGDHKEWQNNGTPKEILNKLINAGEAKPMIVVMPNIRAMNPDSVPSNQFSPEVINAFHNFKNDLNNDLMPFIKQNYNVYDDRDNTAIAGLSMGGMETIHILVTMPELARYYGAFSASPGFPTEITPDKMTLPDEYKDNTYIMGICGLQDDIALETSRSYNQQLENNGIQTIYDTMPGGHGWDVWKEGLNRFAKSIF